MTTPVIYIYAVHCLQVTKINAYMFTKKSDFFFGLKNVSSYASLICCLQKVTVRSTCLYRKCYNYVSCEKLRVFLVYNESKGRTPPTARKMTDATHPMPISLCVIRL